MKPEPTASELGLPLYSSNENLQEVTKSDAESLVLGYKLRCAARREPMLNWQSEVFATPGEERRESDRPVGQRRPSRWFASAYDDAITELGQRTFDPTGNASFFVVNTGYTVLVGGSHLASTAVG